MENYEEREKQLIAQIEDKHGKSIDQLREERQKRFNDAYLLKEPDRVPVSFMIGNFACKYAGIPQSAMYYDPAAFREACLKVILDFEPDAAGIAAGSNSGIMLELLQPRHQAWPGGTLPPDVTYQFIEGEYMKAEEYDIFLEDPSDFILRYYLPRLYGILEPLADLTPFSNYIGGMGIYSILNMFIDPRYKELASKLAQAAEEQRKWAKESAKYQGMITNLGYPAATIRRGGAPVGSPFDVISDFLRGMRGSMIDIYRCPDKLLAACDMIQKRRLARSVPAKPEKEGDILISGTALHRGSDGFMSIPQFEKFYWPGLKESIMNAIDMGYTTSAFCEGIWDARLEYWLEIPKGKAILRFEKTDIFKAKEVLGGYHCIGGGVPPILLEAGTPSEVEEHCKKLIKICGKGGGFLLGVGSSIENAKPENVKAMIDTAKKYGRY